VVITAITGAPNLAWSVSALAPGEGGKVIVVTNLQNSMSVLGTTFTNTATINASDDITLSNNVAWVSRSVIPAASLVVTKTVVGAAPADAWHFVGSGGVGSFTLPPGGGSQSFAPLIPGAFTLTETVQPGYTAAVSCTTGASGSNSVQVTLSSGQQAGCTFTNTQITQTLTVNMVVVGGPLSADDFALFVDGAPVSRGVPQLLSSGQHTVTQTSVPTYTASFGGACNANGQVMLASGGHVTCTITNTYTAQTGGVAGLVYVDENGNQQPDPGEGLLGVTVTATLTNETGMAAELLTDFTGTTDANGEYSFTNVPAGEYTLSFAVPAGYEAIGDAPVTVTAGQATTVPDQHTVRAGPATLGDVYLPAIQR
jgi:hypothetical protein